MSEATRKKYGIINYQQYEIMVPDSDIEVIRY
jgi:hypothetical protein